MSQSHSPTRAPVCSSATARFAAIVDLPTPPLPLATAMTCLIPGIRVMPMPAPAPPGGAWMSISTFALRTPSIVRNALSASFLIAAGTVGSLVLNATCTLTSPSSIWIDLIKPNETMSRVKPGYFTDFKVFFTCSSEIDMLQPTCRALNVNRPLRLPVLVVQLVANLIVASAGGPRRLLAGFRHEVRLLPIRPGAVFRLHWIRRQVQPENPVFASGKF